MEWEKDPKYVKAIEVLLEDEAGFANYRADKGGMTYAGIAERYFPKWDGWVKIYKHLEKYPELREPYDGAPDSVDDLNGILDNDSDLQDSIKEFYYTFFWLPLKLNKIDNYEKSLLIFTTGVLSGKNTAIKYQQICAGTVVDKITGPNTIRCTNKTPDKQFCFQYLLEMQEYFNYITNTNPVNRKFFLGWSNRNIKLYKRLIKSFSELPVCI